MRNTQICRRCESHALSALAAGGRRSFAIPGSRPHYAPDLPFKLEHIRLEVVVDPKAKTLRGTATQRLRAVAPGQTRVRLDLAGDFAIATVRLGDKPARFSMEGSSLVIEAGSPAVGDALELSIEYSLKHPPRRGIYFTGPDADYPKKPYQVWSQGQDEDNRYWFPTLDYPNQKATFEVIATVPKGFTAVSNGALLEKKDLAAPAGAGFKEGTRFHYKIGTPHVTYLLSLVVAEFSEWEDQGPGGLPVQYFVARGREEDGKRAFGNTPKMIEVFARKTGVPYPYEKYSQVAVQDFIFGGMENSSATTQTENTLHDARAHLDFTSDGLVSHELAHQWFGDLITCRDWSHGWLNEGFATFMERVWIEENTDPEWGGLDEARYYQYQDLKDHLEEDERKYRRPIVCNTYIEPIDLFDTHLYQKGGLVLNLLRSVLGDGLFWKSIQAYLTRHRGGSVETLDLIRAIEDTTGRNLRRFFDEWVFGMGYPQFELSYNWHAEKKLVELVIEQKQSDCQLFHLPVAIDLTLEGGKKASHTIEIGEKRERVFLPAEAKPLLVRFDSGNFIPKTIKFPRPKELLLYQLAHDADVMGRVEACHELVKIADGEVVAALAKAALSDKFWGVQAEAAEALSQIRMDAARDGLVAALGAGSPKARRGIVRALGVFKDDVAATALRKVAEKDESYYVEADATLAYAQAQARPGAADPARAQATEKFLLAQLSKPSYREVIRAASLKALAELPGIARGERPQAVQALLDWTRRGQPIDARAAAVLALGTVARSAVPSERARIFAALDVLADEDNFFLRTWLVSGLASTGLYEALPILAKIRELDADGRIKRNAQVYAESVQAAGGTPETVSQLKGQLEKLEEEYRKLRSMFEESRAGLK